MTKTCTGCGIEFEARRSNVEYHSKQCKQRAKDRRRRPTTFRDAVAQAKGPNCSNCRRKPKTGEERRYVLILDGAEPTIENAHYLCQLCFKRFNRQQANERAFVRFHELIADGDSV